jgi:hypothetical protein
VKNRSCQSRCFVGVESSRRWTARQAAASWATHQARLVSCWTDCAACSGTATASDAGAGGWLVEVGIGFDQALEIRSQMAVVIGKTPGENWRRVRGRPGNARWRRLRCPFGQVEDGSGRRAMRWQCWRILVHAHSAMAERLEVVVVVNGVGCAWALRWRRWWLFFLLFVIFFFAGGAPDAGLVAIWMGRCVGDRRQGLCVSDRAPTHVAGRWMDGIHTLMLQDTVTTALLQR